MIPGGQLVFLWSELNLPRQKLQVTDQEDDSFDQICLLVDNVITVSATTLIEETNF